uniref:Diacylglycerol O-acyltransferase n=1 Tax=Auxenochlorella protothecoides TaxID=3075 RepID=A0A1D2A7N3_AUXPR
MPPVDPLLTSLSACWLVFATTAPTTYVVGATWLHRTRNGNEDPRPSQPGWGWGTGGGVRTLVFQALSLVTWLLGCAVAFPVVFSVQLDHADVTRELLAGAAAVGAVSAQLFQVSALLSFDAGAKPLRIWSGLQQGQVDVMWDVKKLPSRAAASYVVIAMGTLWVALGGALLYLGSEVLHDASSRLAYLVLAVACLTMAAFTTYGLAGHLRHAPALAAGSDDDSDSGRRARAPPSAWRFFQPFRGGAWFVATQALGWALFSAGLTLMLYLIAQGAAGVMEGARRYTWTAGAIMVTAQLVLASSLVFFQGPQRTMQLVRQISISLGEEARPRNLRQRLENVATIIILYIPMHVTSAAMAAYFFFLPPHIAVTLLIATLFVYYTVTSLGGAPEVSGRREWPAFQDWFGRQLEEVLPAWLGSLEVVREGASQPLDPEKRYVFGFAAHGLYPLGAGYLPVLPSFRRLLPGIRPVTLTASVVFVLPVLRDILAWLGLRVVTRRSFLRALRERGSVLLVPGGQAELVHTHRIFTAREYCFVRVAQQAQASLVPLLVLGEIDSLRNLISAPAMLQWTYKRLGFPVPYLIVGRWGLTPFPQPTGLRFIIGEPIPPVELGPGEEPTQEQVDTVHAAFYDAMQALWHKHAPSFPGYDDVKFVLVDK